MGQSIPQLHGTLPRVLCPVRDLVTTHYYFPTNYSNLTVLTTLYYNYSILQLDCVAMHFLPIFDFISSFEPIFRGIMYTPSPPVRVVNQSTLLYQMRYTFMGSLGNIGVFVSKYVFNSKKKIKRYMADIELFTEQI